MRRPWFATLVLLGGSGAVHCGSFGASMEGDNADAATDGRSDDEAAVGLEAAAGPDAGAAEDAAKPGFGTRLVIYTSKEVGNGPWAKTFQCPSVDGGTFIPLVRTRARPTIDYFINPLSTYMIVSGAPLGTGSGLLIPGPLAKPNMDQEGVAVASSYVWTGFYPDGGPATNNCEDWTLSGASDNGHVGLGSGNSFQVQWLGTGIHACNDATFHVYCVQVK